MIVVTGAAGFIGSSLVNRLNQEGFKDIVVVDDFSHPDKMTPAQIKQVEDLLNSKIDADLKVSWNEMSVDEAKKVGALGLFEEKYGDKVKVYSVGEYSKEICGGPHVEHTGQLAEAGKFKILKEEAVSAGVRRIKAVLAK